MQLGMHFKEFREGRALDFGLKGPEFKPHLRLRG